MIKLCKKRGEMINILFAKRKNRPRDAISSVFAGVGTRVYHSQNDIQTTLALSIKILGFVIEIVVNISQDIFNI